MTLLADPPVAAEGSQPPIRSSWGLWLEPVSPVRRLVRLAQVAEAAGASHVFVADEGTDRDVYVAMTAILLGTERIAVSAGITQAARTIIDPRNGDAVRIVLTRFKPGTPEHGANIDGAASVNDRASIVAFLTAEARKFAYAEIDDIRAGIPLRADRLGCKASVLRTMAAYIERGDDRQGGE